MVRGAVQQHPLAAHPLGVFAGIDQTDQQGDFPPLGRERGGLRGQLGTAGLVAAGRLGAVELPVGRVQQRLRGVDVMHVAVR